MGDESLYNNFKRANICFATAPTNPEEHGIDEGRQNVVRKGIMPNMSFRQLINLVLLAVLVLPGGVLVQPAPSTETNPRDRSAAPYSEAVTGQAPEGAGTTIYLPLMPIFFATPMITIPAGPFQMGCDPSHNGNQPNCAASATWELPLHTVYLDAYRIEQNVVTNAQYAICVATGNCPASRYSLSYSHSFYYGNPLYDNYPVIQVNLNQATAYCAWLGRRLPTEAEWEKAARGGSDTRGFPWGDQMPDFSLANFDGFSGGLGDTSAVGSYPIGASPYGVLDMAGNVTQWTSSSPAVSPEYAAGNEKVVRGGSWIDSGADLLLAIGRGIHPETQDLDLGFRCADSLPN